MNNPRYEIYSGKKIEKIFSRGAVVVNNHESLGVLQLTSVNGINNCVQLKLGSLHQVEIDGPGDQALLNALEKFDEHSTTGDLTMPCCIREEAGAWSQAIDLLEGLVEAAKAKRDACTPKAKKETGKKP